MNLFNIKKTFEMKAAKKWPEVYFCIDLHGTIIPSGTSSHDKTDHLEFYPHAKEVLQWLTNRKDIFVILWSATPASRIDSVLGWFKTHDIQFDFINSNTHAKSTPRSDFGRKFYTSIYLDDRAGFTPHQGDWLLVARELELFTGDKIINWTDESKLELQMAIKHTMSNLNHLVL